MVDYTAVDAAIVDYVKAKPGCTFNAIFNNCDVNKSAEEALGRTLGSTYRVVDRRLQSLRKRGLIRYKNKGWLPA